VSCTVCDEAMCVGAEEEKTFTLNDEKCAFKQDLAPLVTIAATYGKNGNYNI